MDFAPVLVPLLLVCVVETIAVIVEAQLTRQDPEQARIQREIVSLRVEIGKLSPVADFVEVSKKQRAIGKLEKSAIVAADAFKSARASNYITGCSIAMPYVRMVAYGAVALAFWPTPVANMPPSWFAPLGWTLRLPGQPPGSISAPAWVGICYTVISPLLYAVARAANLLPHERRGLAGGIAGRITQMFT